LGIIFGAPYAAIKSQDCQESDIDEQRPGNKIFLLHPKSIIGKRNLCSLCLNCMTRGIVHSIQMIKSVI